MSTAKFEKLIDLIINEDQERAEQLFHEIVVEKSREIYEGLMSEDMTSSLLDEIEMEETNDMAMEDEDETEFTDDEMIDGDYDTEDGDMEMSDEEEISFDDEDEDEDHHADVGGEEELENRVVDLEDKLDELMAEFEAKMGSGDDEMDDEEEVEVDSEEEVMEAVQLKKVAGLYDSKIGGDDGEQTTSPVAKNSGQAGMASKPVKIATGDEKGRPAPTTQNVKGAGSFKNTPAKDNFSDKGESAPKPVMKDEAGKVKSPVAESRIAKKRV